MDNGNISICDLGHGEETDADFVMVLKGFFDDSGDEKRERFVSVGGLIGNQAQWSAIQIPWCLATADLKIPFHSTDCEARRGCCKGWNQVRCEALMRSLVHIIDSSHLMGLGSVVPVRDYRAVFPVSDEHDPYFLALKHTIINLAYIGRQVRTEFAFDSIQIFIEKGDTDVAAHQIYRDLKAVTTWPDARYLQGFAIDSKRVTALQAADLFAREAFKHADNRGLRRTRAPVRRLKDRICFHIWTRECLEYLRDGGGPDNLEMLTSWGQRGENVPQMIRLYREGLMR
jgi:hypothetical protein